MSKQAWVVTEGDYSDMRVRAVFATEELAKQAIYDRIGDDYGDFPLFEELPAKVSMLTISCMAKVSGLRIYRQDRPLWEEWETSREVWEHVDWAPEHRVVNDGRYRTLSVEGTDHKKVRHIFGEMKAKLMAEAEGI